MRVSRWFSFLGDILINSWWGSKSKLYLDTPADAYLWRAAAVFLGELHDWWMRESLTFGQRTVAFKNNILLPAIFNQLQWLLEGMKLHLQVNQTQWHFSFIYTRVFCNHIHFDQQKNTASFVVMALKNKIYKTLWRGLLSVENKCIVLVLSF